jgi:hypothetical protein
MCRKVTAKLHATIEVRTPSTWSVSFPPANSKNKNSWNCYDIMQKSLSILVVTWLEIVLWLVQQDDVTC